MRLLGPCLSSLFVFIAFCFSYLKLPRRWEMLPRAAASQRWHGQVFCRFFPFHRRFSSRESDDCARSEIYYGGAIVPQATVPRAAFLPLSPNTLHEKS